MLGGKEAKEAAKQLRGEIEIAQSKKLRYILKSSIDSIFAVTRLVDVSIHCICIYVYNIFKNK